MMRMMGRREGGRKTGAAVWRQGVGGSSMNPLTHVRRRFNLSENRDGQIAKPNSTVRDTIQTLSPAGMLR
jgi:hypothetical protein